MSVPDSYTEPPFLHLWGSVAFSWELFHDEYLKLLHCILNLRIQIFKILPWPHVPVIIGLNVVACKSQRLSMIIHMRINPAYVEWSLHWNGAQIRRVSHDRKWILLQSGWLCCIYQKNTHALCVRFYGIFLNKCYYVIGNIRGQSAWDSMGISVSSIGLKRIDC